MRYQNKGQLNDIFYQTTDYLAPSHAVSTRPDTDNLKENQSNTQICKSKVVKFDIEFNSYIGAEIDIVFDVLKHKSVSMRCQVRH